MTVLSRFNEYVRNYHNAMSRRRTQRVIGTLPPEILKDIGWPSQFGANHYASRVDGQEHRGISRF